MALVGILVNLDTYLVHLNPCGYFRALLIVLLKKNWANPGLFFVYFRHFLKKMVLFVFILKNGSTRPILSFLFGLFKQTLLQFLQQIYVKNLHPVYCAGI